MGTRVRRCPPPDDHFEQRGPSVLVARSRLAHTDRPRPPAWAVSWAVPLETPSPLLRAARARVRRNPDLRAIPRALGSRPPPICTQQQASRGDRGLNLRRPEPVRAQRRLLTLRVPTQTEPYWNHHPPSHPHNQRKNSAFCGAFSHGGRIRTCDAGGSPGVSSTLDLSPTLQPRAIAANDPSPSAIRSTIGTSTSGSASTIGRPLAARKRSTARKAQRLLPSGKGWFWREALDQCGGLLDQGRIGVVIAEARLRNGECRLSEGDAREPRDLLLGVVPTTSAAIRQ